MTFKTAAGKQKLLRLEKYNACQIWLERFKSSATKRSYVLNLQLFCRFYRTNPDELLLRTDTELEDMIMRYVIYLKKTAAGMPGKPTKGKHCGNSIPNYIYGVRHFLKAHKRHKQIDWEGIYELYPEKIRGNWRAYRTEEIANMLNIADVRMRVIILLMTSGGMRVGALPELKFKHIKKIEPHGIGLVSIYAHSSNDHYYTLLNRECMDTIEKYKQHRIRLGEKITEESYVLRDHFAHFSRRANKAKPLKVNTIIRQVRRLVVKALPNSNNLQTDHGLRKFFDTALKNSDVNRDFKELLMGHDTSLDEYYYDEEDEKSRAKVIAEYLKASDALTINDEYRLKQKVTALEQTLVEKESLERRIELLELNLSEQTYQKYKNVPDLTEKERIELTEKESTAIQELIRREVEKAIAASRAQN